MRGFAHLRGVSSLTLDGDLCDGCRTCLEVCPHQVFAMQDKRAKIVGLDACMECGACALNCPQGAILVESGVGCAAGLIREWFESRGAKPTPGTGTCC